MLGNQPLFPSRRVRSAGGGDRRLPALLLAAVLPAAGVLAQADGQDSQDLRSNSIHGLRGHYYASGAFETDALRLPVITGSPAAVRVDPQVAFGRDGGFIEGQGAEIAWAPAPISGGMAVVWRGYIRFPERGTYYLTTVSRNGSAVYLNRARVALNGNLGNGYIPSESFTYAEAVLTASYNEAENTYLVPIEVDGPRVYALEVRYVADNIGSMGFGIDLYWVTPDAQRGLAGKPVAEIVPTEVLYAELPDELAGELVRPEASAAHTTIESDFLYYPAGVDSFATLKVRVADAENRPLAGRRVHVSTTSGYGPRDVVEQPDAPTDQDGVATIRVRPSGADFVNHVSRFTATVLGEFVDAGQQTEMHYSHGVGVSFLPYAFAPYYDGRNFLIAPQPLQVGREATITVPLTNRQDEPYEVYITVTSKETNIGLWDWNPLGRSESVVLAPGETQELSIVWTPEESLDHVCFRVTVWGKPAAPASVSAGSQAAAGPFRLAGLVPTPAAAWAQGTDGAAPLESRQQNVGAAAPDSVAQRPSEWEECTEAYRRAAERNAPGRYGPYIDWHPDTDCGFVYIAFRDGRPVIRQAPSLDAPAVGVPGNGERTFYSQVRRNGDQVAWYRVHPTGGGTPGWVPAENTTGNRRPMPISPRPDRIRDSGIRSVGAQGCPGGCAGGRS